MLIENTKIYMNIYKNNIQKRKISKIQKIAGKPQFLL